MQLRYKFFSGERANPFEAGAEEAYARLTEEREAADNGANRPLTEMLVKLASWPDFLMANSKSVFWQMERAVFLDEKDKSEEIDEFWQEGQRHGEVGEWLKAAEADESVKAMCYYLASLHYLFNGNDFSVDFRYYITEGKKNPLGSEDEHFSLEAYE